MGLKNIYFDTGMMREILLVCIKVTIFFFDKEVGLK